MARWPICSSASSTKGLAISGDALSSPTWIRSSSQQAVRTRRRRPRTRAFISAWARSSAAPRPHGMALGARAWCSRASYQRRRAAAGRARRSSAEVARLRSRARHRARRARARCASKLHGALAREVGEFIDAHSLILDDPELTDGLVRPGPHRPLSRQRRAEDAARPPGRRVRGDGRSLPAQPRAKTSTT